MADQHLPSDYPFGPFVDVYSFLERVKSPRDVGESHSTALADMDTRRKSNLSADEATLIEAFQYPLPKCFRGSSSSNPSGAWLPGLKTKEAWLNKSRTRGIKLAIEDSQEGIRFRLASLIDTKYAAYPEAQALAHKLLADTSSFITSLGSFITTTQDNLENAGYPAADAWDLVSKLLNRIFATDCYHNKRGAAMESMDSEDRRSMARGVLWATFATHQIMREYQKHNFADHPSIAGEYTRFLVANAGVTKIERALGAIEKLSSRITALDGKVDQVERKAITAANKADEAVKAVKKKAAA